MILGFTGTRNGLTAAQRNSLGSVFEMLPDQLIHGGAIGADTEFDEWFKRNAWSTTLKVDIYPADQRRREYWLFKYGTDFPWLEIHQAMPPLDRNQIIAQRCDHLLACPHTFEQQLRSGTWATVRYARAAWKPITLLLPDGTIKRETGR